MAKCQTFFSTADAGENFLSDLRHSKNNKHFLNVICLSVEEKLNTATWCLITLDLEEFQRRTPDY